MPLKQGYQVGVQSLTDHPFTNLMACKDHTVLLRAIWEDFIKTALRLPIPFLSIKILEKKEVRGFQQVTLIITVLFPTPDFINNRFHFLPIINYPNTWNSVSYTHLTLPTIYSV